MARAPKQPLQTAASFREVTGQTPAETQLLQEACARVAQWFFGSRRSEDTFFVTKGAVIRPPIRVDFASSDGLVEVTITGANEEAVVLRFNRVVVSRFRPSQLGFFVLNDREAVVERRALATLPLSKQLILAAFPAGSEFSSEELYLKITKADSGGEKSQAHARRRWKELKFDFGFDVDFDTKRQLYVRGEQETPVNDPIIRPDDSKIREEFWDELAAAARKASPDGLLYCNLCAARIIETAEGEEDAAVAVAEGAEPVEGSRDENDGPKAEDVTGITQLQQVDLAFSDVGLLDHRRPVPQGGEDESANLQIICRTCNNKKNTVCRKCPYSHRCDSCILAFPESRRHRRLVIVLDEEEASAVEQKFGRSQLEEKVREHLIDFSREGPTQ